MWQVKGQTRAVALLEHSLEQGHLPHAYLLVGLPHIGKMTLALNLAQALNCAGSSPPCGQCQPCHRISSARHADVQIVGLAPERNSGHVRVEISIEHIKEIQHAASLPPYEGRHKVFIIDGAEHLSSEAANRLLKILEEPPPGVLFLLLTAKEGLLLPTVISRCQRVELLPLPIAEVEQVLLQNGVVGEKRVKLLARLSHGCLGWALSAMADEQLLELRKQRMASLIDLADASYEQRFTYASQLAEQFERNRETTHEILDLWLGWWHDLLLVKGNYLAAVANIDLEAELLQWAKGYTLTQVKGFIDCLQAAQEQLERNANPRLALEVLMLNIPRREGEKGGGEGTIPPSPHSL